MEHSFLLAHYLCTKARVYMHVSRCSVSALCAGPLSLVVRRPDDRTGWRQRKHLPSAEITMSPICFSVAAERVVALDPLPTSC